jgi:hypothetical protein
MKKNKEEKIKEFIESLHVMILFWDNVKDRSSKEKMQGLTHSILCMLDGCSGTFDGNIHSLARLGKDFMFHDFLYQKDKNEN